MSGGRRFSTSVPVWRPSARTLCVLAAAGLIAGWAAPGAGASQPLADRDVKDVSLKVNPSGEALIVYTRENGQRREVLAWGAVDAVHPSPIASQVQFKVDYAGGWRKYRKPVRNGFRDTCRPYDGPRLVWLVAACKAGDGSYWALQSWQRIQPMRGFAAFRPAHMRYELHLSHWTGPLGDLQVSPNWTYGGMWQGLFGRLLYRGKPVHGYRTPSDRRSDFHARYFYIDTYDSVWGQGWKRAAAKVTHNPNGGFCFSFVRDRPPPAYPSSEFRPPGNGERHRVTVMGPGVTPVVQWEGPGLGAYDRAADAVFDAVFDEWLAGDRACVRER
ncbi:MAG: hypothetical protein ICV59_06510 [Thermoleophilia bacterium]|nr:hypothetical protein [Thermoleophilia bacterium]